MTQPNVSVDEVGMRNAANLFSSMAGQFSAQRQQVDGTVGELVNPSSWQASSATQFQSVMATWATHFGTVIAQLENMAAVLGQNQVIYVDANSDTETEVGGFAAGLPQV